MVASTALPGWVVCPLCRSELSRVDALEQTGSVSCTGCATSFEVRDGIPLLLDEEGRALFDHEEAHDTTDSYQRARHESPLNIRYYDYWCSDLYGRAPMRRYERVVELMAGGGEMSRRAANLPRPIVALDLSHKLLSMNRAQLVPDTIPVCGSATRLPFADASIDLIVIQGGLHHVRRLVDKVLAEIARVMVPGGVLLASEPRNDNPVNRLVRRAFYHLHPIPDAAEEDGFTEAQLRTLMGNAGLTLKSCEPFAYLGYVLIGNTDLVPWLGRSPDSRIGNFFTQLDATLAQTPLLRNLGWASQIVAEKAR